MLGGLLGLPAWRGNLRLFAIYWAVSMAAFVASRRSERVARFANLAVALLDVPMVFFIQWATIPTSPSASGVAGFTVGVYVLLVILAALSLENWYILFTAAVAAAFEVALQYLAGVSVGGMISTVILLGLAAAACSYARQRLVELAGRVDRDIAEQQRAERVLRQTERMASLGTLAAGVAHEVNTPLTYVVTNLALISERLPALARGGRAGAPPRAGLQNRLAGIEQRLETVRMNFDRLKAGFVTRLSNELHHEFNNAQTAILFPLDWASRELAILASETQAAAAGEGSAGEIERLLHQAQEGAERVRTIIRDLKTFSRPDEEALWAVELSRVLESSINLTSSEIHHRARLRTEFGAAPPVMATEARLGQVFVNLLVNAAQAIPEGAADDNEITVITGTDAAGRATVEVRDTGSGMEPEVLRRLFDPFFTTKPVGEGTGLGLSICHGIVRSLGGELSAESERGRGSTFRVVLPPAPSDRLVVAPAPPAPAPPVGHRARLLVVDDDAGIGDLVREALTPEHEVVALTRASDALQLLTSGEHFDVILCDLMMPVMTGMDLYEGVATRVPTQADRMVFLTGGVFTPRAEQFLTETSRPRLDKPFDLEGLRSFVRARLAAGPPARDTAGAAG